MAKKSLRIEEIMVDSKDFPLELDNFVVHESSLTNRLQLCNLIKGYFDFAYYLGLSPFRIVLERKESVGQSESFVSKTWKPQQIVCVILHTLCGLRLIAEVRYIYVGNRQQQFRVNPTYYFTIAVTVFYLIQWIITIKRFWMNKKNFVHAVNVVAFETKLPLKNSKILSPWFVRIFYGIYTIIAISGLPAGKDFVRPINNWAPSFWYSQLIDVARYTFFVGDRPTIMGRVENSKFSPTDHVLAAFMGAAMFMRHVTSIFVDLCILVMAVTLWTVSHSFEKILKSDYSRNIEIIPQQKLFNPTKLTASLTPNILQNWSNIFGQFKAISNVSNALNSALGSLLTWCLAQSLIYYSIHLNEVILTRDWYRRVMLTCYYTTMLGILLLSADICHRLQAIRDWLEEVDNVGVIPVNEVNVVLHGLLENTIGIQGNGRFTVTYSFLATLASLVITYFIICLDHEFDPSAI